MALSKQHRLTLNRISAIVILASIFFGTTSTYPAAVSAGPLTGDGDNPPAGTTPTTTTNTNTSNPVSLVADINPGQANSSPDGLHAIGQTLFFSATDTALGRELWRSNPPYNSAKMVADINAGSGSSNPKRLVSIGETLLFTADNGKHGMELWKSNPPYTNAELVRDINPGKNSAFPKDLKTTAFMKRERELVTMGTTLIFAADDGESGEELWRSTPPYTYDTTTRISDIRYGADGSNPHEFTSNGWMLFFVADDGTNRSELYKIELPYTSVQRITDTNPRGDASIAELATIGTTLFFSAKDKVSGQELWKTDAPYAFENAQRVTDLTGEPASLGPVDLVPVGNTLFFSGYQILSGYELWKSEPPYEALTTYRVADTYPGNKDYFDDTSRYIQYTGTWSNWSQEGWGFFNNTLHYSQVVGSSAYVRFTGSRVTIYYTRPLSFWHIITMGSAEVWIDGDYIATISQMLDETATSYLDHWTSPMLGDGDHQLQIRHSSGLTFNLDAIVANDYKPPETTENREPYRELTGSATYDDFNPDIRYGGKPWRSWTGTLVPPFKYYNDTHHYSDQIGSTAELDFFGTNVVIQYSETNTSGMMEVWVDGQKLGTINQNAAVLSTEKRWEYHDLPSGNHSLLLKHISGNTVDLDAIFVSNNLKPTPVERQVNAFKKMAIGDTLIFRSFEQGSGMELYRIDPPYKGENIKRIAEVNKNPVTAMYPYGSSYPEEMTLIGASLYFTASDFKDKGREIWKADPPYYKVDNVTDLMPNKQNSNPYDLTVLGRNLFFAAGAKGYGIELWKLGLGSGYLPGTGFTPGVVTTLPPQPPAKTYTSLGDLWLEVPSLGIQTPIVGVPATTDGWDLSWLGNQAGFLDGTAFPTHDGNTVLTGHLYLSNGAPGLMVDLHKLKWGDKIFIHAWGQRFIYEVRYASTVDPDDTSVMSHKDEDWLTLITCKEYDESQNSYRKRTAVQAVRLAVVEDTGIFK